MRNQTAKPKPKFTWLQLPILHSGTSLCYDSGVMEKINNSKEEQKKTSKRKRLRVANRESIQVNDKAMPKKPLSKPASPAPTVLTAPTAPTASAVPPAPNRSSEASISSASQVSQTLHAPQTSQASQTPRAPHTSQASQASPAKTASYSTSKKTSSQPHSSQPHSTQPPQAAKRRLRPKARQETTLKASQVATPKARQNTKPKVRGKSHFVVAGVGFKEVTLKWKRYVVLVLVTVFFLYALTTIGMSVYYSREVIHPQITPVVPIKENIAFDYSSVSFRSRDELTTIRGWLFNPVKKSKVVALVHGFGENRFPFAMETLDIIEAYADIGFDTLVFDLRNSGDAGPTLSTFGLEEKDDVLGAINYLKGQGYKNIVLHGFSTGANAAVMAASQTPTDLVGAIILDSPIIDINKFVMYNVHLDHPQLPTFPFQYTIPLMVSLYTNNNVYAANLEENLLNFIPRHVLMIHGDHDEIVSKFDTTQVYNKYLGLAVGKISIWHVPNATHARSFEIDRTGYLEKITSLIQRVYPEAT